MEPLKVIRLPHSRSISFINNYRNYLINIFFYTGIKFYITPNFTYLAQPQTWATAAFQVFYSLGPGWGGLITMGSYNKFHNNCYR